MASVTVLGCRCTSPGELSVEMGARVERVSLRGRGSGPAAARVESMIGRRRRWWKERMVVGGFVRFGGLGWWNGVWRKYERLRREFF